MQSKFKIFQVRGGSGIIKCYASDVAFETQHGAELGLEKFFKNGNVDDRYEYVILQVYEK